jgi:hypothetical protein
MTGFSPVGGAKHTLIFTDTEDGVFRTNSGGKCQPCGGNGG